MKTYMIVDEDISGGYMVAGHMPQDIAIGLLDLLLKYGGRNSYTIIMDYCEEEMNISQEENRGPQVSERYTMSSRCQGPNART